MILGSAGWYWWPEWFTQRVFTVVLLVILAVGFTAGYVMGRWHRKKVSPNFSLGVQYSERSERT